MTLTSTLGRRAAAACLAGAVLAAGAAGTAHAAQPSAGGDLYVMTAQGGTLTPTSHKGEYRLVLEHPAQSVASFADHPQRSASEQSVEKFIAGWKADGFAADPPNAALVVDGAPADHDVMSVELSHPRLTRSGDLILSAKRLPGGPKGALKSFASRSDATVQRSFGRASVFVDDGQTTVPLTVNVTLPARSVGRIELDGTDAFAIGAYPLEWEAPTASDLDVSHSAALFVNSGDALSGQLQVGVLASSGPITGTATLPAGATVTARVGTGPVTTINNGAFRIPTS
jgi:hypothetical protein